MIVAISDPDDVQLVLSNPTVAEKAYFYKFFQNDHGLLTSQRELIFCFKETGSSNLLGIITDHIWKVHRKILNPAFAINNIRANVIPVFQAKTDLMLQRMRGIEDNTDCQLVNYIKFCLLETSLGMHNVLLLCRKFVESYRQHLIVVVFNMPFLNCNFPSINHNYTALSTWD